jgi:hypothetical protein
MIFGFFLPGIIARGSTPRRSPAGLAIRQHGWIEPWTNSLPESINKAIEKVEQKLEGFYQVYPQWRARLAGKYRTMTCV